MGRWVEYSLKFALERGQAADRVDEGMSYKTHPLQTVNLIGMQPDVRDLERVPPEILLPPGVSLILHLPQKMETNFSQSPNPTTPFRLHAPIHPPQTLTSLIKDLPSTRFLPLLAC